MRLHHWKKYGIGASAMLVLVAAIVLATGSGSAVAAQITSVFVTNGADHPVPVHEQGTATVAVSGTPNVNVANTTVPVHEQGTAHTSSADQTALLASFDGQIPAGFSEHDIDITSARTVRVTTNCFVAACSNVLVRIYVLVGGRSYLNDQYSMTGSLLAQTHVYDVLGQDVAVQFVNQNSDPVDNVGLAVFGRSN